MLEELMVRAAALSRAAARRRRADLAERLREDAPAGAEVDVEESEEVVTLIGRGIGRRFALNPALRFFLAGRVR